MSLSLTTAAVHLILIGGSFIRVRHVKIRRIEMLFRQKKWISVEQLNTKNCNLSPTEMSVAETMANTGSGIPISVSVMTTLGGGGKKSSSKKDSACIVVPANLLDVPD